MKKTDKRSLLLIGFCAIGMLLILAGLYALSPLSSYEPYRGSFNRDFLPDESVQQTAVRDLGLNSFYFSGLTENEVYLSNYTVPSFLMRMDYTLSAPEEIRINIRDLDSIINPRQFRTQVVPPYFYMMHGNIPVLLRGKVHEWEARRFMSDSAYFVNAIPIDTTSFALRFTSRSQKSFVLALEIEKEPHFIPRYDILQKQQDGYFSVDGMLHYSKEAKKIVYLYSYRNQFMVMDKQMNLLHRFNTLDTISIARIKSEKINSEGSYTLTSQPSVTQRMSAVYGNRIYIHSGILANNEEENQFNRNTVIDVYDLAHGNYLHSFYIPSYKDKKVSDFKVFGDKLLAIHNQTLIVYQLAKDVVKTANAGSLPDKR